MAPPPLVLRVVAALVDLACTSCRRLGAGFGGVPSTGYCPNRTGMAGQLTEGAPTCSARSHPSAGWAARVANESYRGCSRPKDGTWTRRPRTRAHDGARNTSQPWFPVCTRSLARLQRRPAPPTPTGCLEVTAAGSPHGATRQVPCLLLLVAVFLQPLAGTGPASLRAYWRPRSSSPARPGTHSLSMLAVADAARTIVMQVVLPPFLKELLEEVAEEEHVEVRLPPTPSSDGRGWGGVNSPPLLNYIPATASASRNRQRGRACRALVEPARRLRRDQQRRVPVLQ